MTIERELLLSQTDTFIARGRYGLRTVDVVYLKRVRAQLERLAVLERIEAAIAREAAE